MFILFGLIFRKENWEQYLAWPYTFPLSHIFSVLRDIGNLGATGLIN